MSNEERNDEQVDETSDAPEQEGQDATEEPGGSEDLDVSEDEYSYSGKDATSGGGGKAGGTSAGIWVIIVLVIAALIAVGWYQWSQTQRQAQVEAAQEREQIRERQLGIISGDVREAADALDTGDIDTMIDRLEAANEQLDIIARAANSAGDTEAAQRITAKRNTINQAIQSLQPVYAEIEAKRAEIRELEQKLMETARTSLQAVGSEFDVQTPAPEPAEPEVADEDAAAEEADAEADVDEDEEAADDADAAEADSRENGNGDAADDADAEETP